MSNDIKAMDDSVFVNHLMSAMGAALTGEAERAAQPSPNNPQMELESKLNEQLFSEQMERASAEHRIVQDFRGIR